MYKVSDYLADFKTVQNKSRTDIIFLIIFFILLFIPMSKINKSKISFDENREFAAYKPFINKKGNINYNFGKDFENWFNDRFGYRGKFIGIYDFIKYEFSYGIVETPEIYFNKKNNWQYIKSHIYKSPKRYKKKTSEKIIQNLNKFNEYCVKNGIKLYVMVVPYNAEVYNDKIFPKTSKYFSKKTVKMVENIQKHTKPKLIFPYKKLKDKAKEEYTYYKVDHHWTDYGAFIGYKMLMKEVSKDFSQIKPLKEKDFDIYRTNKLKNSQFVREFHDPNLMKNLPYAKKYKKKIYDTEYSYYTHYDEKNLKTFPDDDEIKRIFHYYYEKAPDLKILTIGTSMQAALYQFIPYTFRHSMQIRVMNDKIPTSEQYKIIKLYGEDIKKYKPDIIVLVVTTNNINGFDKFFKE